jgi:hypothetical protein
MRLSALTSSLLFLLLPATGTYADSGAGLYPPGLQPLITRANVLLSTGQFNEAARVYSEAIGGYLAMLYFLAGVLGECYKPRGRARLRIGTCCYDRVHGFGALVQPTGVQNLDFWGCSRDVVYCARALIYRRVRCWVT